MNLPQVRLDKDVASKLEAIRKEYQRRSGFKMSLSEVTNGAARRGIDSLCKFLTVSEPKKP